MTDNEIKKGLECHSRPSNSCGSNCPYLMCEEVMCTKKLSKNAFDLINRQEVEIERLEVELKAMRGAANSYKAENEKLIIDLTNAMAKIAGLEKQTEWFANIGQLYSEIKAEAYKEFVEKAKNDNDYFSIDGADVREVFDNLLNELVGDGNGE